MDFPFKQVMSFVGGTFIALGAFVRVGEGAGAATGAVIKVVVGDGVGAGVALGDEVGVAVEVGAPKYCFVTIGT